MAVALGMSIASQAQDIHINAGEGVRIFAESTSVTDNTTTFGYAELSDGFAPYVQLFREWKAWKAPLYLHYEVRTSFAENTTTFLLGETTSFAGDWGVFSLSALCRYDGLLQGGSFSPQLGQFWNIGKRLSISGYADEWIADIGKVLPTFNVYAELRLYYQLTDSIALGAIIDHSGGVYLQKGCRYGHHETPRVSVRYTIGK